jgi:alpha-tubulin suppressor-like RCC1 family protein
LTKDGSLFSWGLNDCHQLGFKSENMFTPKKVPFTDVISHISAGEKHAALISLCDSEVYTWGSNQFG